MTSIKTILAFLEGAQTIIALYQSPDGPVQREFAFDALADLLNDPELLRAQIDLRAGNDSVMLMGEPSGPMCIVSMRPALGAADRD